MLLVLPWRRCKEIMWLLVGFFFLALKHWKLAIAWTMSSATGPQRCLPGLFCSVFRVLAIASLRVRPECLHKDEMAEGTGTP